MKLAISQDVLLNVGDQALPDLQAKFALHNRGKLYAVYLALPKSYVKVTWCISPKAPTTIR